MGQLAPGRDIHYHRAIKRVTRPMLGFKAFEATQAILTGIELMHMIKKKTDGTRGRRRGAHCGRTVLLAGRLIFPPTGQLPLHDHLSKICDTTTMRSRRRRYSGIDAMDHHSDARWHGDSPTPTSPGSHRWHGGRNAWRYRPAAAAGWAGASDQGAPAAGMGGLVCTQCTRGLVGQASKRFGHVGAFAPRLDGRLRLD